MKKKVTMTCILKSVVAAELEANGVEVFEEEVSEDGN